MKILIDNEEVVSGKDFTITEEMLNTPSVILNNVYPKAWENDKDYVSRYYYPKDYSKCKIINKNEVSYEILGSTTQNGIPTPNNPVPIINKTGIITETIEGKNYTINIGNIELCKIGNYQDKIYKSNDKWYLHKEIEKVTLDENSNFNLYTGISASGYTFFRMAITTPKKQECLSSHFNTTYTGWNNLINQNVEMAQVYTNNWVYLKVLSTRASSVAELQTWLGENTPTVYYILNTATDTQITDELLINQLESVGEELLFCGVVKNTGKISLNPRYPHFCDLQILDFKMFLSEIILDFVIANKTIEEAIQQVTSFISSYGFVVGNIQLNNPNEMIGAYSTKDKSPYDVFNYIADITQSRWTTRMVDQNTVAIDFYNPELMEQGTAIEYTTQWFEDNKIDDISYSYGTYDYRNKQIMTSDKVMANISSTESIYANGYQTQYNTEKKIGNVSSVTLNGISKTIITNENKELGQTADFYYTVGNNYIESDTPLSAGDTIVIDYIAIVQGRQIITNSAEINRVASSTGRNGTLARYENRNDATTSDELQKIGQSYIKYKGTPEIKLNISTRNNIWEIGQKVEFNAPITELSTEYMVKRKNIKYIATIDTIFYTYELTSSFNSEREINYFDNQRAKNKGNIGEGEYIARNIDLETNSLIYFYDTELSEVQVVGDNILNSTLESPLNN